MNRLEVHQYLVDRWDVPRETLGRLDLLVELIGAENTRQNLVSQSSLEDIWSRHILDSAQLVDYAPEKGIWLDVGTGAGFPGIVVALLRPAPTILVESRRLRCQFLAELTVQLGLPHVSVIHKPLEKVDTQLVSVVSARAFASLSTIFALTERFATSDTIWVLPKGRSVQEELAAARESWQGEFHVKQSITEREASIIVAQGVRPRGK